MKLSLKIFFSSKTFASFGLLFGVFFFCAIPVSEARWCYRGFASPQCFDSQAACTSASNRCYQETSSITKGTVPTSNTCTSMNGQCISLTSDCSGTRTSGVCYTNSNAIDSSQVCCIPSTAGTGSTGGNAQIQNPGTAVTQTVAPVHEASGLVPCGTATSPDGLPSPPGAAEDCTYNWFITGVQTVINFLLFTIAIPLAALSFAWAGWLYMSAGASGKEGNIAEAHKIFSSVAMGLAIALAAWLIVSAIITGLGVSSQFNFLQSGAGGGGTNNPPSQKPAPAASPAASGTPAGGACAGGSGTCTNGISCAQNADNKGQDICTSGNTCCVPSNTCNGTCTAVHGCSSFAPSNAGCSGSTPVCCEIPLTSGSTETKNSGGICAGGLGVCTAGIRCPAGKTNVTGDFSCSGGQSCCK